MDERVAGLVESGMSEEAAKAALALMDALQTARGVLDEAELMKVLGMEAKAAPEPGPSPFEQVAKSALSAIQAGKADEAEAELAKAFGQQPIAKSIAALSPEMQAAWAALEQRSAESAAQLEAIQKSISEKEEAASKAQWLAVAKSLNKVPMGSDEMAGLLHSVAKSDPAAGEAIKGLLEGVQARMAAAPAFAEVGGSGATATDRSGAYGKVAALAEGVIQKSTTPLTKEQAISRVLEENPNLYSEYCRQAQ